MNSLVLPQDFDFQDTIPLWKVDLQAQRISREFIFADFSLAFEFMKQSAQHAEELDHHPDWSNSWNKVLVHLTTHSTKGLTSLDIQLAQAMDILALKINALPLRHPLR
jgi:4a-hydroxytetrahydrobiopterin dehydratase